MHLTAVMLPRRGVLRLRLSPLRADDEKAGLKAVLYGQRLVSLPLTIRGQTGVIYVSRAARKKLRHPAFATNTKVTTGNLHLGPAFAIYALPRTGQGRFGAQTKLFAELARLGASHGVDVFVVTPGHLRYEGRETVGYRYQAANGWVQTLCPWPDFVWRRVTERPRAWVARMASDEQLLSTTTLQGTLPRDQSEKWLIQQQLAANQALAPHLPPAFLVENPLDLIRAARMLKDVYVKPTRGTQGMKIARVIALSNGFLYRDRSSRGDAEVLQSERDLVLRWSAHRLAGSYLAQRTVPLMTTASQEPFDLRYLIQAQEDGKAVCTAIVARLGPGKALTTNLHTGALAMTINDIKDLLAPDLIPRFLNGVEAGQELAQQALLTLQQAHPFLVELGVDVALAHDGKAFILEVNPVPGRKMLRLLNPSLRRLSLERVIEYAVWSTGFSRSL